MKRSLSLLFGFSVVALAQEPEPPAPGTRVPVRPGVPNPLPDHILPQNAIEPVATAADETRARRVDPNKLAVAASGSINKANITALAAAQLYEDHSGKRVIMSNAVAQSEVSFTMRGPLTNGDIAKFVKLTLLGEGLAMIPIPGEPGIVRLVPSGVLTSPSQVPKEVYTDEYALPSDDQLVIYQMVLRYLKPEDALRVIQSSVGALSPSGNISAVPNASSLMITENSSLIRQMIKIQKLIDVPNPVGEKWVTVTYGDVDQIAERMNEIYNEQSSNRTSTRTTRTNTPPNPGSTGGAVSGEEIPLRIIGVRRTSRILLVGRPSDLVAAEAMVRSFDQPSSGNTRQTFRLRYLRVADFIPIAQNAIAVTLGDSEGAGGGNNLGGGNANNNNNNNNNNNATGDQGGDGPSIQEQNIPTAPESVLVENTLLVGDNVANTVIVNGPPHHIEIVRDLIADLDTESQQVALSAVVGSYAIGDGLNFGLDLASTLSQSGSTFTAGGGALFGNSVLNPDTLDTLGNILTAAGAAGSGVSIYGALNDDFGVFINALETNSKFKTLERTVLTTRNNRVAEISSGQRIAIPTSTFNSGTTGTSTNIEFRDVTLELQIQPLINSDNQVTLEISLVRDSLGLNRDVGELTIPDINTDQLTSSVTVQDGSAVILGGIITTDTRDTKSSVPILSRIPGVGKFFGRTENSTGQSELVIMIQPRILGSQADLKRYSEQYSNLSPNGQEVQAQFLGSGNGTVNGTGILPPKDTKVEPKKKRGWFGGRSNSSSNKSKIRSRSGRPGR